MDSILYDFMIDDKIDTGAFVKDGFAVNGTGTLAGTEDVKTGAIVARYDVSLSDGEVFVIKAAERTTETNNASISISAANNVSAKDASALEDGYGFVDADAGKEGTQLVTDIYGDKYYVLDKSATVYVNSSVFTYNLNNAQTQKFYAYSEKYKDSELVEDYKEDWESDWKRYVDGAKAKGETDIIKYAAEADPEAIGILFNDTEAIIGEIPVLTYKISGYKGDDTTGPEINDVAVSYFGNDVKLICDVEDTETFVTDLSVSVKVSEDGNTFEDYTGVVSIDGNVITLENLAQEGKYEITVSATNYAGVTATAETPVILDYTIASTEPVKVTVDADAVDQTLQTDPVAVTPTKTLTETEKTVDYVVDVDYSGEYTFKFDVADKLKLVISYMKDGKVVKVLSKTLKDNKEATVLLDKDIEYKMTVTSSSKTEVKYQLLCSADLFRDANQVLDTPDKKMSKMTVADVNAMDIAAMDIDVQPSDIVHGKETDIIATQENREWVGFSDAVDLRVMNIVTAGSYTFRLCANGNAKMTVYTANEKTGKLKKLTSVSVKPEAGKEHNVKSTKSLLLDNGTYYIAVEAPKADKGQNAYYHVQFDKDTVVYENAVANEVVTDINDPVTGTIAQDDWVGFGNEKDISVFTVTGAGSYKFNLTGEDIASAKVKLTVREDLGNGKYKTVKKFTASAKDVKNTTGLLMLNDGKTYEIVVEASKANKGINSYYSLTSEVVKFNSNNNDIDNASKATAGEFKGVVSEADGADAVDFIDVQGLANATFNLESGKVELTFFNAAGDDITSSYTNKDYLSYKAGGKTEPLNISADTAFIGIGADSKNLNQYSIVSTIV